METVSQSPRVSKKMIWAGMIISALPALFMLITGLFTLANPASAQQQMEHMGYPARYIRPILIVEVACVVIYLIPQTSVLGAILLTGYLGGATATHVRVGEPYYFPIIFGVLVWMGLYFRDA